MRKVGNKMNDEKIKKTVQDCIELQDESEWFEFKENTFDVDEVGKYISSLSNSTAILGKEYGYLIWGINNQTKEIVGTSINFNAELKQEPIKHILARKLAPSILFSFHEIEINKKRLVVLVIPAAKIIPTSYAGERYIRIGSSKENIKKYPEREANLFSVLTFGLPTICTKESEYQNLTFEQLFAFYSFKGIKLSEHNFKENLGLLTKDNKFNILAQLLSDNSHIPIRFAVFAGKNKAGLLHSVREFGYKCLLVSLKEVLDFGNILNIPQAYEENRLMERKEVMLFNENAFREAVVNAFLHNKWVNLNEPMFTAFSDRIEILSRGELPTLQTLEGFYNGHSIPVNDKLSEIFLQLKISEKTGRGIPLITNTYGKNTIKIANNSILVTIPYNKVNDFVNKEENNDEEIKLNLSQIKVLAEIRNNPKITIAELAKTCEISDTAVDRILKLLKSYNIIQREGANKNGYWKVLI